jgi:FkbM family methyltransferase
MQQSRHHVRAAPIEPAGLPRPLAMRARALAAAVSRRLPGFRGKERAVRAFEACLRRIAPGEQVFEVTVDGVRYALQTEDLIDYRIAYLSAHDGAVTTYLDGIIGRRGAVLWDVGANVGSVSLPLAQRHRELRIEAFEPSPAVASRLRRNLALNVELATRIRLHEIALCERVGHAEFFPSAERSNSGVGTLMASANTAATPVRVRAETGDALIASGALRPPDVIKIDVEGFEYEVLCGLRRHLGECDDPVVVFEHEPYRLRGRTQAGSAIELLRGMGFTLFGLTRRAALEPLQPAMLAEHVDIVARRQISPRHTPLSGGRRADGAAPSTAC